LLTKAESERFNQADRDERIHIVDKLIKEGRFTAPGKPGTTAQWDRTDGGRIRSHKQSMVNVAGTGVEDNGMPQEHVFEIPRLVKRTKQERLESMIRRLKDVHPTQQAALLQQIGAEYWKAGMPVTMDALRKAASDILNKVDGRLNVTNVTGGK
jgi:hypothetical protein